MKLFASAFPRGIAGIGLLLLRAAATWHLLACRDLALSSPWLAAAWGGAALLMAPGFLTPFGAAACIFCELLCFICGAQPDPGLLVEPVLVCLAVGLAGPGAYSVDARLFGRRRVLADTRSLRKN